MKKFIIVLLVLLVSGMTLIIGKLQYDKKLERTAIEAKGELTQVKAFQERNTPEKVEKRNHRKSLVAQKEQQITDIVLGAVVSGVELNLVAIGSSALTAEFNFLAWPQLLERNINDVLEKTIINVEAYTFGEDNTFEIIRNHKYIDAIENNPDILLIEPFLWNNRGHVRILDTLNHLGVITRAAKRINEDVVIILQPPNPIFNDNGIDFHVEVLKDYAIENDFLYFDHWESWPIAEELSILLTENNTPNQQGHEFWAEYIASYFVKNR